MRIGIVSTLAGGGPVEHALVLARALGRAGGEIVAVCGDEGVAERFEAAGARAVVAPVRQGLDVGGAGRMRRALAGCDVVHAQDRRAGLWTRVLPRVGGAVRVYTVHGLPDPYLPPPAGPRRPGLRAQLAYRGLDTALARRADALVTPSHAVAELLVRRLGVPAGALVVIPNAIEPGPVPRFSPPEAAAVGSVSVLEPVKALDVLLDAFARLDRPGLRLLVFGSGSQAAALEASASRLGLGDRVEFPGFVPAPEALARLSVFALPSLMENCPMGLLEAMAAGVPAVASRVGGVPEVAPAGTARLVPPRDPAALAEAIAGLLDDPERAREQAERARAHVEAHASPGEMAARTLELYASLRRRRATGRAA